MKIDIYKRIYFSTDNNKLNKVLMLYLRQEEEDYDNE